MSSTADTDPFIQFQNELANLLESARTSFSSYLRIRALLHAPTAPPSPELLSAQAELITLLDEISTDLSDLHATVRQMEADPYKFGLDVPEVVRRRRFVDEVEGEVGDMREEINATSSLPSRQNAGATATGVMDDGGDEEGGWSGYEMQYQQEIIHDQDEMLEGVSRTVVNLREQANVMNRELEEQTEVLGALDGDVDRVEHKLKKGVRDLNTFIRKNEGLFPFPQWDGDTASSCCIAILIVVLIFLLFLVVIL
ncbi:t-SNARE [Tuber indicum]|nr:t-SNARE [Tuber indicum]